MSSTVKKVGFLIFLTFIAVTGGFSMVWFATVYPDLNKGNPFESSTYASSLGASKYENNQERRDGKNTTTLEFTVEPRSFVKDSFFEQVKNDIAKLEETELINIVLKIGSETETTYEFAYYPSSPESYTNGKWDQATDMFLAAIETEPKEYSLTLTERGDATKVDVGLTSQWLDWTATEETWEKLVNSTQEFYPLVPGQGNIYNINYDNLRTPDAVKEVALHMNTTLTSQLGIDRALNRDFSRLKDVAEQNYSYLHFEDIKWTINPEQLPFEEQIVFVIEDKGGALNDALVSFQNEISQNKPYVPSASEYVFRYQLDGENIAVFPSYYMKQ